MVTPPTDPLEIGSVVTTVDSLKDDNIEDILLRLPSPASVARTAVAYSRWRHIASSPPFLRRFRELHPSSPVLGLFVSQAADPNQLPVFHPASSVRSDPELGAVARWGDFLLTRLGHDPAWRLRDCRNGRLLLCRGDSLSVYDPVSHRHVVVRRPHDDPSPAPAPEMEYIADCLLGGHGEDGACSRVVTVQRDGQRIRAIECHSCTTPSDSEWRFHPWVDGITNVPTLSTQQPMHAAAAGLIFWRCDQNSSLMLDTSTMTFSMVPLPVPLIVLSTHPLRSVPIYAIGETEAGACCLVFIAGRAATAILQVWLLNKNVWELEKQCQIGELAIFNRRFGVRMVVAGLALVQRVGSSYSHFLIDLKNLSLKDKFLCHRSVAYPYQMPWPPAGLLPTSSTCERSKPPTYVCGGAEKQHESPSSSRKRKSNDEMSSGKEKMEPCISVASLEDELSVKKFCYETGVLDSRLQ